AQPGELAARTVLADALLERGDPRGELIALQCSAKPGAAVQARRLIKAHWTALLGDLALVLDPRGTEFHLGMLTTVRVGIPRAPAWAFTKVHDHRDLATVRTVMPGQVSHEEYVAFLSSPNLRPERVGFDTPAMFYALETLGRCWPFRAIEYRYQHLDRRGSAGGVPPLHGALREGADWLPDVEELVLDDAGHVRVHDQMADLIEHVPAWFPRIERIVVRSTLPARALERFRGLPRVTLEARCEARGDA
nr:hypothetical protein [Myxococcota bacterium]